MPETAFVHLHCQSEYSIKNGLIRVPRLIEKTAERGMGAVALTDENNLFAAVKFYQAAIRRKIKPIFGVCATVVAADSRYAVLLLCQNRAGYLNLCALLSDAYLDEQSTAGAAISESNLQKNHAGLICLALPTRSDIAGYLRAGRDDDARKKAQLWQSIFADRYYFAVQRTGRANDEKSLRRMVDLALEIDVPVAAINDVQFLSHRDFQAHEIRSCIADGSLLDDDRRIRSYSDSQYLKSAAEMAELFADLPEALANTVEIAKRCNVHFELYQKNYLPAFPLPAGSGVAEFFENEAKRGLKVRAENQHSKAGGKIYQQRLKDELAVIVRMGFEGYFLIVSDFIRWAKESGIPVGPGRGSGAGSLVAYALNITDVDPIEHGLLFERFLNPERVSMPDFDIDFCALRRDEVIDYVAEKYGNDKVSQIITYGAMAAKGVVRDVCRVLGHNYGFGDGLAKLIPNDLGITLTTALAQSEALKGRYDSEESVATVIDLARELEGLARNVGTHAGGVVIAPTAIRHFCPIYKTEDTLVSQFDKDDIEAVGLVKFDFLGLGNLTVVDKAVKLIEKHALSEKPIAVENLDLNDEAVYRLLQNADTTGIFQLESDGIRSYLKKLKPNIFEDIVAILALYRPGPLDAGMVDDYIRVKHGAKVRYPHPMLEEILAPTNGIFLYQEQVMQCAQLMAGYSLGEADLLRRAMGKKKPEEMAKQRDIFILGAKAKNVAAKKANEIFDLMDKFSGYGFNKSHSVAYAYISYQTAWLKAHYPAPFIAALLSLARDNTERVAAVVREVRSAGLVVRPPDINRSDFEFDIEDAQTIIYGLGAIKGVGEAFSRMVVAERARAPYRDLFDFCMRIEKKYLNKRAIESLIYAGAFDDFGVHRARLVADYPAAVRHAEQCQSDEQSGQNHLFAGDGPPVRRSATDVKEFSSAQALSLEKSVLGFYLSAHPMDYFKDKAQILGAALIENIARKNQRNIKVMALVAEFKYRNTAGGQMTSLTLEDGNHKMPAVIFANRALDTTDLKSGVVVVAEGLVRKDFRGEWQLVIENLETVETARMRFAKSFHITLRPDQQVYFDALSKLLKSHGGNCPVRLFYRNGKLGGAFSLGDDYRVMPSEKLLDAVNHLIGEGGEICY